LDFTKTDHFFNSRLIKTFLLAGKCKYKLFNSRIQQFNYGQSGKNPVDKGKLFIPKIIWSQKPDHGNPCYCNSRTRSGIGKFKRRV